MKIRVIAGAVLAVSLSGVMGTVQAQTEVVQLPAPPALPALPVLAAVPSAPGLGVAPAAPSSPIGPLGPVGPMGSVTPSGPASPYNPGLLEQRATRTKHVARTFPVNGREVRLDGRAMELRVEPTDGDQATIEVDLEYWSRSEEWMDLVEAEFDIEVNERSRVIEISGGRMPERNESWWRRVFGGREHRGRRHQWRARHR